MRTLGEYVRALRALHAGLEADDPLEETWRPAFRIVEHGAEVAPDAVVHDSVVFAGGRVESGAVVVRSVVGPGGAVGARRRVVDRVVGP
jgi:NDP-sugar pyrophosphorylase family protein